MTGLLQTSEDKEIRPCPAEAVFLGHGTVLTFFFYHYSIFAGHDREQKAEITVKMRKNYEFRV